MLHDIDGVLLDKATQLAKADLVTGTVGEFPELQGIMGGHLARAEDIPLRHSTGDCRSL
jgi:glycyl-tRNA synthetase beta chain